MIQKNVLRYFWLLAGGLFLLTAQAQEQTEITKFEDDKILDQVVAVVGKNIILKSDIETQYLQYRMQGFIEGNSRTIKCDILKDLIFQNLLLNQADVDSIVVGESQVDQELDRRFRYFISQFGSKEKLEEYYDKSVDEFKDEMRVVIKKQLIQQSVQGEIVSNVGITPKEVKAYYKEIPQDSLPLINTEYFVAELVKEPQITAVEKLAVKERLLELRKRILKGESFATLAILYSEDPGSAKKGGELGMYGKGELYPEFEDVAFNLKEGEISGIVETEAGFHVIQMIENQKDFVNVRHILLRPKVTPYQIQETVSYLDSIYNLIQDSTYTFAQAVKLFSDNPNKISGGYLINPQTGNNMFQAEALDPKVFYVIDKMQVGDVSKPTSYTNEDSKEAYRLLQLVEKTPPHRANIEQDYDKIYNIALNQKHQAILDEWVVEHAKKAYIRIVDNYSDCELYNDLMSSKK
ncbi:MULTISPECIES: peptidylprolyl isomerase [unclassified Lentimicrobium]|uniref:peptidylprolyl isomerase n=1 Tax=unclassified Lentimicrobium TaxID=2677434 RepID=UPI0015529B6A|nr:MULTISPECIES: peptidylprolyl isomerase [unclassified Lentimicrobium]NPD46268.1 peptidylprolyl isomerase [Lentimicrobium sp. S6]NPD83964.1 peptidylprolyl isomerase [Lentimicrobium sp. L6]